MTEADMRKIVAEIILLARREERLGGVPASETVAICRQLDIDVLHDTVLPDMRERVAELEAELRGDQFDWRGLVFGIAMFAGIVVLTWIGNVLRAG